MCVREREDRERERERRERESEREERESERGKREGQTETEREKCTKLPQTSPCAPMYCLRNTVCMFVSIGAKETYYRSKRDLL